MSKSLVIICFGSQKVVAMSRKLFILSVLSSTILFSFYPKEVQAQNNTRRLYQVFNARCTPPLYRTLVDNYRKAQNLSGTLGQGNSTLYSMLIIQCLEVVSNLASVDRRFCQIGENYFQASEGLASSMYIAFRQRCG